MLEFVDEKFWLALCFIIFVAAVFKPARKAVLSALDESIKNIKQKINEAFDLRQSAEELQKQNQQTLSELNRDFKPTLEKNSQIFQDHLKNKESFLEEMFESRINSFKKSQSGNLKLKSKEEYARIVNKAFDAVNAYLADNRKDLPSDLEIAKSRLSK